MTVTNVSLKTTDSGDPDIVDERHVKCTHFKVTGQRNVLTFPLKMLKVMNDLFKLNDGTYDIPPVIAIDSGSIVKRYHINFYFAGTGEDPVADAEDQAEDFMYFIDFYTWLAEHCYIRIGSHITWDYSSFALEDMYTEGKVTDYEFEWDEKDPKRVIGSFDFISCHELDWF